MFLSFFAGTAKHRLCDCEATREVRATLAPTLQHRMTSDGTRMQWERALVADPAARHPFRAQRDAETWWRRPGSDATRFEGDVASDGSMIGNWADLSPTGFGVAMVDSAGDTLLSVWGPMPYALPVQRRIARAELHAVLVMLRNAQAPATLWVDCQLILDGVAAGQRWCTSPKRQHADVWREIWTVLLDIGLGGITFAKVKAHQTRGEHEQRGADSIAFAANREADLAARRGATEGGNIFLGYIQAAVAEAAATTMGMLTYFETLSQAVLAAGIMRDVECVPRSLAEAPRKKKAKTIDAPRHQIIQTATGLQCVVCRKQASKPVARAMFSGQPCEGSCAVRLVLSGSGEFAEINGHKLWLTGQVVWCSLCGCYSTRRLRGLADRCGSRAVQQAAKRNLAQGKRPTATRSESATHRPTRLTSAAWALWRAG